MTEENGRGTKPAKPPVHQPRQVTPKSKGRPENRESRSRRSRGRRIAVFPIVLALVIGLAAGFGAGYMKWKWERPYTVDLKAVEVPKWVKQEFIRKNIFRGRT